MVHSLLQERWREKRPDQSLQSPHSLYPTGAEPTCWDQKVLEILRSITLTVCPLLIATFYLSLDQGGVTISPIVVTMIIFLILIIIFVVTHYHHHRHPHGMVVGRVIPWPASDPSLDSVELCHENQHCAPFTDSLYHHHHQDIQFKDVLDVYLQVIRKHQTGSENTDLKKLRSRASIPATMR